MFATLWSWLTENAAALGIVLAALPIIWAVIQFILIRRAEAKRIRFETYHSLVKQLSGFTPKASRYWKERT